MNRISIVIPVYNRSDLLNETLESIKGQIYRGFECLLIDDGSEEYHIDLLKKMISADERFKFFSRKNKPKGASTCRNIGISEARGEFTLFLDSDDLMAPWCLEQRLSLFDSCPEKDFIVCQTALFRHEEYFADRLHSALKSEDDLRAFIRMHGWGTSSTFFKTNFLRHHKFDEQARSWQDIEFHIRLLLKRPNYRKFPDSKPDVFKRFGGGDQISATNVGYARLESLLQLFRRLEKELLTQDVAFQEEFLMYYFKFLEIGARVGDYGDFQRLMEIWQDSPTHHIKPAKMFATYLRLQAILSKFGLYKLGSVPYRLIRPLFPNDVLDFTAKHVMMDKPIDLKDTLKLDESKNS